MKVLVVGATGMLGSLVCRGLVEEGIQVRTLVRPSSDAVKVGALRALGAETVKGDLKERASLDAACANVDAAISTANSVISRQAGDSIETVDERGQLSLVEAATKAGVKRFVYVSVSPGRLPLDIPFLRAKRSVEERLRRGPMEYVIVQPGAFMEIWLSPMMGFNHVNATATVFGSGENPVSYISIADVARFIVTAVDGTSATNRAILLGGPRSLSPNEIVRIFERETGKRFEVQYVPEEALRAQFESAADPLQKSFAGLSLVQAAGDPIEMTATLQEFPMRMTSVEEYVKRAVTASDQSD